MCGIALIILGIRFDLDHSTSHSLNSHQLQQLGFDIDDLEAALRRRGPDSLGTRKLFLQQRISSSENPEIVSFIDGEEQCGDDEGFSFDLANGRTEKQQSGFTVGHDSFAELHFFGATLQLRGVSPIVQPLIDSSGNILVYNGEIFGGVHIGSDENDAAVLMQALEKCCSCNTHLDKKVCYCDQRGKSSVKDVLSTIRGPWALIYWQDSSRTLWFGRDAFGRRSLLVHWPTVEDSRFMLSSVSPLSSAEKNSDLDIDHGTTSLRFWEELPCGIYSLSVDASNIDSCLVAEVKKHEWTDALLEQLIKWERTCVEPVPMEPHTSHCKTVVMQDSKHSAYSNIFPPESGPIQVSISVPAETVLCSLRESVRRRSSLHTIFQSEPCGVEKQLIPVAVLFSGGLDSMILAALLNECLDPRYEIDLLNVSFDGESAPDRISAKAGVAELRRIAPSRKWKLVEIDSDLSTLTFETKHVMSLISPSNTFMDLNIGIALWLAAGGDGWMHENYERVRYRSKARILLVGSGADEQCAGYGRHRTKYRNGSWLGLNEEMKLDMQRIWKRNLGRDDRCIADNGKEARFPFLDEDVIKVLLDIPLWEVTDLNQPSGVGDKKILREVAQLLGLHEASSLPKRAIQFGTRIARESNRKNFGSNRAANQASAGSVVIHAKTVLN
ncbi:uncharacterized protein LOC115701178 isoform X1 [Cannabis sativa]|uniref:uncharacterized protein LOC115701178 isoform X1 n=1 Tax=Cannabis sativa TaxID=3483 RepID=UPI0029CA4C20|nr:uncharacterized protein LOC115701178 isoform X1 [Cannabis sativa]